MVAAVGATSLLLPATTACSRLARASSHVQGVGASLKKKKIKPALHHATRFVAFHTDRPPHPACEGVRGGPLRPLSRLGESLVMYLVQYSSPHAISPPEDQFHHLHHHSLFFIIFHHYSWLDLDVIIIII